MEAVELILKIVGVIGTVLGVLGFFLAIYNIWWDRRKFAILRQERLDDKAERLRERDQDATAKQEQSKERVTVKLHSVGSLDGTLEFVVPIYNPCTFAISIRRVLLHFLDIDKTNAEGNRVTTSLCLFPRVFLDHVTAKFGPNSVDERHIHGAEIESRQDVTFKTMPLTQRIISNIAQLLPADVYLTIQSPAGQIARINGEEIISACKGILAAPSLLEKSSSKTA